jgi:hypothetical protein
MIYVPERFRPKHPFKYPSDNETEFERWYYENFDFQDGGREYLPVFWTAYYCRHKFGQDTGAMKALQVFLNKLDRSKKYYTIIQYDGGLLHDVSHLDIKVFSMSGGRSDYPLPLISMPHSNKPSLNGPSRSPHFLNFVGKVTHPVRTTMIKGILSNWWNYINTTGLSLEAYCKVLRNSTFTLCPRGFGPTSFRIQEALQYGSIPVYISDEFIIPHNLPFEDYGVLIEAKDAHRVHEVLTAIPAEEITRKQSVLGDVYRKYYTYEGCREMIRLHLQNIAEVSIA